jgi:hypothetical protein
VFTPYSKKWLAKLNEFYYGRIRQRNISEIFISMHLEGSPSLDSMDDLKKMANLFRQRK